LSHTVPDPFAEDATRWWKRLVRNDRRTHAPKRATRAAAFLGGLIGWTLASHHSFAVGVLAAAAATLPAGLVESWYKRRRRHEEEQLFVLPTDQQVTTNIYAR
jgi:hypothetical protein